VLSLVVSNSAAALLDKTSLTFTPANWNVAQHVVFRPVDNHVLNSDQQVGITVAVVAAQSEDAYDAVAPTVFTAAIRDDDLKQGDLDRNDRVEQADYDVWRTNYGATSGAGLAADGNRDGSVNGADYVLWRKGVSAAPSQVAGDYDRNGTVQTADYTLWRSVFGSTGASLLADGNQNGAIDSGDYVLWRKALPATPASAVAANLTGLNATPAAAPANAAASASSLSDAAFAGFAATSEDGARVVRASTKMIALASLLEQDGGISEEALLLALATPTERARDDWQNEFLEYNDTTAKQRGGLVDEKVDDGVAAGLWA
jgi:hypothetical protein